MSRCDYEGVFYRVFCISLLVIAFTFTVILTNVFIDIDGLLSRKEQAIAESQANEHATPSFVNKDEGKVNNEKSAEKEYLEGVKSYDDEGVYRTKRSLDSTDFLLHIKNPKIKHVLANRLATLLEDLDDDESRSEIAETTEKPKNNFDDIFVKTDKHATKASRRKAEELKKEISVSERKDDVDLHAAMHNLLREGIVGHMDLNSVYRKVHALVRSFQNSERKQKENYETIKRAKGEKFDEAATENSSPTTMINEEYKFFEELIKCKKLQEEVMGLAKEKRKEDIAKSNVKTPKYLIKTLIDIQKNDKEIDSTSKENFKGIIKLVYNGKSVKIKSMDEYESTTVTKPIKEETTTNTLNKDAEEIADLLKANIENNNFSKTFVNTILTEYLKKYKNTQNVHESHNKKRLKRNIKPTDEDLTDKNKKKNDKVDDDELFVEIETHFDNKGIKGKKKEELVKQLIEKIQKAIRSNQEENKQLKHLHEIHVKKRVQNPLEHKNESHHVNLKDIMIPYSSSSSSIYRELYPISKIGTADDPLPIVSNSDDWINKETGPKFMSSSKSINSAELSQVDVDFKKVMEISTVPQRLQIPLNTDLSGENPNAYFDLGNLQFLIKDLEGSGFSIGLNQYVDHPPDPESIKLFTGIEQLVSKYHHNHDQNLLVGDLNKGDDALKHEIKKRDVNMKDFGNDVVDKKDLQFKHKVSRRSVYHGNNYHSNEYNFIYQDNFLPYNNYQEIYEDKQKKVSLSINNHEFQNVDENEISMKQIPKNIEQIFEKKLNPSEIFNLASLLDRKKRSISVHRFQNLNKKIRMSTLINTNAMPKQRLLFKSKRNKRQIGKIRIIAKDSKGNSESDENIYIVSGENMYADRAVIRHISEPNYSTNENKAEEQVDEPILFENTKPPLFDVFEESVRSNPLMLKYPHIFLDDINDKLRMGTPTIFGKIRQPLDEFEMTTENGVVEENMPKVQALVNALTPFPKTNYKFTVKLLPKDSNITNAGFREVHTSINKTFNKDGMLYSSIVNVSEISKIESSNSSERKKDDDKFHTMLGTTTPNIVQNKHEVLKSIIKAHRERINSQLENLNKEKERLSSFVLNNTCESTTERKPDLMDILLNLNESNRFHFNKDDIGKLLCNAVKQQENARTTTVTTTIKPESTTTPKLAMDPLKVKLLKAISQNEQLTSQILHKIDQNSLILQSFLTKITDKIQTLPDITRQAIIEHEKKIEIPREPLHLNYPNPHFFMKMSNNKTNLGIPFIYYQQPNEERSKVETPAANIAYRSYINPSPVDINNQMNIAPTNSDEFKNLNGDLGQTTNGTTKYFVDEDYFRTYIPPGGKVQEKTLIDTGFKNDAIKGGDQKNVSFRHNKPPMHKPHVLLNNNKNVTPYRFKSNAPKNDTKSV